MADTGCPTIVNDATLTMVEEAYTKYTTYATYAFNLSVQSLRSLALQPVDPIKFSIAFNAQGEATYTAPIRPNLPSTTYNTMPVVAQPPNPNVNLDLNDIGSAPVDNSQPPSLIDPTPPNPFLGTPPSGPPVLQPIVVPAAPSITMPADPTTLPITLPTPIAVNLPTFQGVRPQFKAAVPGNTFAFTPEQYTDALLDKVSSTVSNMLNGGTGLPAAVIQALRARAYAANDIEETRAIQQAVEEYASRGFPEPDGPLKRRLAEVRQNNQNERNKLSRDIYINDEQIAVENLRFAVTQGVALESKLIDAHTDLMRISLDAMKTSMQIQIDLFNAQVTIFNAEQQAYATDAQVFRDLLQAELDSTIGLYSKEIEAQKLISDINMQSASIYAEKVRGLLATAEMYRAEVAGCEAQAQVNTAIIEAFRAQVQAYGEQVSAYEAEWNAFRAQVDSNASKARVYEISENAYATRVQAWRTKGEQVIAQGNLQIAQADLNMRGWRGKLDLYIAQLQAEKDRVTAAVQAYGAGVDLYRADASIQETASQVSQRTLELNIERSRAQVDTALKATELQIQQFQQTTALLIEKAKTIAATSAQLAASAMTAVHFGAAAQTSTTQAQECRTTYSISD